MSTPDPGPAEAPAAPAAVEPRLAGADFDDLLREVLTRVHGALDERQRWELLLDAVVTMAADLSLDGLLTRIVEVASNLAGARYAALGVLGVGPHKRLRTFIHTGVTSEQVLEIGDLPHGFGLLGLIIDRPEPLRLHDIADHPASIGFPEGHPPMRSFLGVPVRTRDKIFGNLYLTEKHGGGDFTPEDERIVVALAAAAGVAIENAQLYDEAARRERWLAATAEITGLLAGAASRDEALQAIADRAREVAEADAAWILTGGAGRGLGLAAVAGAATGPGGDDAVPLEDSVVRRVLATGAPVSVERLTGAGLDGCWRGPELGPAILVPLRDSAGTEGVLALAWVPERLDRFHAVDASLPASFAEQAALALQVAKARDDQQRLAVYEDRDRIGRDLHDVVIQRLFALGLSLQGAGRRSGDPEVAELLETAVDDLDATIKDIRRTIFALGSLDTAADIQAEVSRMVDRAAGTLKFRPRLRFEGPVRTRIPPAVAPDILAVLGEALSNASRHAEASAVQVELAVDEEIVLTVADDGQGIPAETAESGLRNMRRRAEALGGRCEIDSRPGAGTTVRWAVPFA